VAFLKTMALGAVIDVEVKQAITQVSSLSTALKMASRGFKTLGRGISSFGTTMLKVGAIGVGLAAGVGFMANAAGAFEQQMAKVQSVMVDVEGRHMPALKRRAEELALATKFSSVEVGRGMELMARAGFKTEEVIGGIGGVLNLAALDGLEMAEASGIVSSTLKGMGLEAEEAGRLVDVLAVASTSTKSDVRTLGQAMGNAATTARTFGLTLEDTVAAVALMQDIGIDAAESGTALKTMLLKLASPSDKIKKKMNSLGFHIQDASGNMLPFQQIIENLSVALPKLGGNIKQAEFLTKVFGLRGIKAGIALADAFQRPDGNLTQMIAKLKSAEGAAQAMSEIKLDNLRDQIGLIGSSLEVLSSRSFTPFLEIAKDSVKDLVFLLNEVAKGLAGEGTSAASDFGRGMMTAILAIRDGLVSLRETLRGFALQAADALGGRAATILGTMAVALVAVAIAMTPVAIAIGTMVVGLGTLLTMIGAVVGAFALLGAPAVFAALALAIAAVLVPIAALVPLSLAAVATFAFMKANGGSVGKFLALTWARVTHGWEVFRDIFVGSWDEIKIAFLPALALLQSAFADVMSSVGVSSDQTSTNVVNIATALGEIAVASAKAFAAFLTLGAVAVKVGTVLFKHLIAPMFRFFQAGAAGLFDFAATFTIAFNKMRQESGDWLSQFSDQMVAFVVSMERSIIIVVNTILNAMIKITDSLIAVANNSVVAFAMKKAGLDPTAAAAGFTNARAALKAAREAPKTQISDELLDVQRRLKGALDREARQRAAVTSPEVTADVVVDDKRTICIQNELKVDGREFALAGKEAEVELTERAGFTVTPWQRRQILERGATLLNPT